MARRRYDLNKQNYDDRYRDFMLEKVQFEKVYGKQDYRPQLKPRNSSIRDWKSTAFMPKLIKLYEILILLFYLQFTE